MAKPKSFEKLNSQLTRARCYVIASGRNANYSDITVDAIKNAMPSLFNMPLVARLYKREDGKGYAVGAHDSEWIWNADDILEINDLTVPYGVIPENCNPQIEEVLEPDGLTKNTYAVVDVLIWSGRYNIMDAAYDDNTYFNQSAEILVNKGHYDDEYYVIEDYEYSALCLLGKSKDSEYNRRPCFPSARVERSVYSIDEKRFKSQFALLMQEVRNYNNNEKKEDDVELDGKEIVFADVCDKIKMLISKDTYRSQSGKSFEKYIVLSVREESSAAVLLDRTSGYNAYLVPYMATQTEDDLVVTLDFDNKTALKVGAVEDTDAVFNVAHEVDFISKDTSESDIAAYSSNEIKGLEKKLNDMTEQYGLASVEIEKLKKQLSVFEKDKKQYEEKNHRNIINALMDSRRSEMGNYSEFLEYVNCIDYAKSEETVAAELKEIHYNYMLKNSPTAKKQFSAIETNSITEEDKSYAVLAERYGEDMAKYFK
jgi:hypothetical protein